MDYRRYLCKWLETYEPELANRIALMKLQDVRQILNAETGLDIQGDDCLQESCSRYLDAFIERRDHRLRDQKTHSTPGLQPRSCQAP